MSDTVKYSDLMSFDEYSTTAKDTADKNKKLQQDTAKRVLDATNSAADKGYEKTATEAGIAKERNLIDADTAYKLNDVKYGAEAEAMGRMGLTGSGMGEYRQAEAYAQNRADRQASYAEYDRVMREAGELRDEKKLDAEVKYSSAINDSEIEHNNAMAAINEKEFSYAEGERRARDAAYSGFIDGINNGTLTLDQIKADSSWAKLSPEQRESVINAATKKGILTGIEDAIANGATLEDVQKMDGWNELGETEQNAYKGAIEDRDESISGVVDYIIEGANAVVDANGNPTINSLSALNSFLNGYADINGNLLSNDIKEKVIAQWTNNNADIATTSINGAKFENGKLVINGEEITGAELAEDIKNGVYGDRAKSIVTAFVKRIESETDENDVVSVANALSQISPLYTYGANIAYSNVFEKVRFSTTYSEIDGNEFIALANALSPNKSNTENSGYIKGDKVDSRDTFIGAAITDNDTISALEKISSNYNNTKLLVRVGSSAYYRKNGKWYEVKILTEEEQTQKDAEEAAKKHVGSGKNIFDAMEEEEAKENGIYGKPSSSSTVTTETDENGNRVLVFGKKK